MLSFFVPAKAVGSSYINHFLQPDSLIPNPSNPQAWNRYSYVGNRPINFNDPTGHVECESGTGCRPPGSTGSGGTHIHIGGGGGGNDDEPHSQIAHNGGGPPATGLISPLPAGPACSTVLMCYAPPQYPTASASLVSAITGIGDGATSLAYASALNYIIIDGKIHIYGERFIRTAAGLNPSTNWISINNAGNLFSTSSSAASSAASPWTWIGIAITLGIDYQTYGYSSQFAAAATVDVISTVVIAGAAGAAFGFAAGSFAFGVGAIPGAVVGAAAGVTAALITSVALSYTFNNAPILSGGSLRDQAIYGGAMLYDDINNWANSP
jgi:hypothetical protein